MTTYMAYTYLIGWSKQQKYYYGVRFAKNCTPSELWVKYFTSSSYVKKFREQYGEPDILQIRKTFTDTKKAKIWEDTVLRRLDVRKHNHWLNQSYPNALRGSNIAWNTGLTKDTSSLLKEVGQKISNTRLSRKHASSRKGLKLTDDEKKLDSWRQIIKNQPNIQLRFNNYNEFTKFCIGEFNNMKSTEQIARELDMWPDSIKTALSREHIKDITHPSWNKIRHKLIHLSIGTYDEFVKHVHTQLSNGTKIYKIAIEMGLSNDAIKRAASLDNPSHSILLR